MRHDEHYVEALAASAGAPVGRMISIELLDPNPNQPRQVMGDLSELMASVAEKGVIEPLIVRQRGGRYQIIAGERRYHAAVQVGLREIPVVVREVDDIEVMELALVENLQRKDLTAFEEAEALHQLAQKCDYTHEDMARKLGKSRTAITESLQLNRLLRSRGAAKEERTVPIDQVQGIDIAPHPWEKLLAGKTPAPEALAKFIPQDNWYARFRSLSAFGELERLGSAWGGNLLDLFQAAPSITA
jgi:ParB/RepB/Spo0J family partition protein